MMRSWMTRERSMPWPSLADDSQGSTPASLGEKVDDHVSDGLAAFEERGLLWFSGVRIDLVVLMRWCHERPIDEHWPPDQILFRDEAPVPAVAADVAIIAHGEITILRHNQLAI